MPRSFRPNFRGYIQAGIMFALAAWLYAALAIRLAIRWWQDPNYTPGFFVPLFSLFLIWAPREKLAALRIQPSWSGLGILLFALISLVLGTIDSRFFLSRVSLLFFVA